MILACYILLMKSVLHIHKDQRGCVAQGLSVMGVWSHNMRLPGEKVVCCRIDSTKFICHMSASQTFQSISMLSHTLYIEYPLVTKMPR